jgi:hypothetical protein
MRYVGVVVIIIYMSQVNIQDTVNIGNGEVTKNLRKEEDVKGVEWKELQEMISIKNQELPSQEKRSFYFGKLK